MTSLRHNTPDPTPAEREPRDAYLDAARACILDVGWKRTTLTEVARRAGVSRMTIYRTWADMPTLLGDLMTREWTAIVAAGADLGSLRTPEEIVDAVLGTVRTLRENDLFVRIVEVDPELILPYLIARRGRSQELIIGVVAGAIRGAQRAGAVRAGDAVAMGRGLVLAAHGFVLSAHTMIDDVVTEQQIDDELRTLLLRGLQP